MKIRREAKVGLFALLTMAALYWGINFLRGRDLFHRTNVYYAMYDQLGGIQKSSQIKIKGYNIGTVSEIYFDPSVSDKIVIEFSIKSKYKIPDNSQARIFSDGLLGGKAIEIEMGNSTTYLHDGDTLRSSAEKDLLELAGSELEFVKQKANVLVNDISTTLASLNSLMADNAEYLNATFGNISQITGSLRNVVVQQEEDLRSVVINMNALAASLGGNAHRIENMMANLEGFSETLNEADVEGVIGNLSSSLAELNATLAKVNTAEGSIGKLLNDNDLYDSLVYASSSLGKLLDDIQSRPSRYVQFSVFGKKDK